MLREVSESQDHDDHMKGELDRAREDNITLQHEINTLKDKNEYLESLIVKLERRYVSNMCLIYIVTKTNAINTVYTMSS